MELTIIFVILVCHWIFDFLMQTDAMATNKSKNNSALFDHVSVYSYLWLIPIYILTGSFETAMQFTIITFGCHWITDYFTSRWTTKLYEEKRYRAFFRVIGFDQLLHYFQLFITYYALCHG